MSVKKAIQDVLLWRGLNFLSAFILNVMVARLFEAENTGSLFFVINNLSLVILLLSFSLESGIGYYTSAGKISPAKAGALALLWTLSATIPVALFFFSVNTSPLLGVDLSIPATCFITGSLLISFYSALYYATGNFIVPNACSLTVNLILSMLFIAGLFDIISIQRLLYAYFIGFLVQGSAIAMLYFYKEKMSAFRLPASSDFKLIIRYSLIALIGNIIFFLVYRIDYWFVEEYTTQNRLGNYIQVSKIVQWFLLLPLTISSAIFPLTAAGKDDDIMHKVVFLSRLLFWLFFFACILLAITGSWFFVWLFGDSYSAMYPVFLLYIPGILSLAALYPLSSYHAGIKRPDINVRGSLLALLIIVLGNSLFTPPYGIYAAAIVSSIGYLVYFTYSLYIFNKSSKIKVSQFFIPNPHDYSFLKAMLLKRK